jgi:hypothetical protein
MPIQPPGKDPEEMEAEGDSAAEMNGEEDESEEERSGSQTESEEESSGEPLHMRHTRAHTQEQLPTPPEPALTGLLSQRWTMRTTSGAEASASVRC